MRVATSIFSAALLMVLGTTAISQGQETVASTGPSEPLKAYLREYLSLGGKVPLDATTRITVANVKTDDGKAQEDIVYVSGQRWCGSGGCTMLILESAESSFKLLGRVTIVQLPIRLLPSMSDGHPDIGVRVQGGGVLSGYEAILSFSGQRYPGNPSLPPARKSTAVQGRVLIGDTDRSVSLYD